MRRTTPASFTGCRSGASAIRAVPGTFSAQPRISAESRASSLSFSRSKKRRKTPMLRSTSAAIEAGVGLLDHVLELGLPRLRDVDHHAEDDDAHARDREPERDVRRVRDHERSDQQRDQVHHLDQRVQRRAGRVLERVARRCRR